MTSDDATETTLAWSSYFVPKPKPFMYLKSKEGNREVKELLQLKSVGKSNIRLESYL